ncbi:MAG TPA: Crp/Fnr family transcriptional regulator [Terriglobia bacterium]|nr:Crp/Fnr family transcriptional regulator [Terriglobia bacterium]
MPVNSNLRNGILHSLPAREFKGISADLRPVLLPRDATVLDPGERNEYIYFPTDSVISVLGDTGEGGSVEVWAVGNEGAAGMSTLFGRTKPFRGVVQVPGGALMAQASALRRHFQKGGAFHDALLRYYHYLLVQISCLGICNNNHGIEQRFTRWLLMMQDRIGSPELRFTQDAIAAVLGTRRATISVAAAALQSAGLISYTPGSITIRSRKRLLNAACRCYKVIRSAIG